MDDWRRFRSLSQFDSRSRRRCGNVETRVLCGFPSSEGGQNRCGEVLHHPALGASFPQRGRVYRPFCRECAVWATDGAEMRAFQKAGRLIYLLSGMGVQIVIVDQADEEPVRTYAVPARPRSDKVFPRRSAPGIIQPDRNCALLPYCLLNLRTSTLVNCQRSILAKDCGSTSDSIAVVGSGFSAEPLFISIIHTREWRSPIAPRKSAVGLPVKSR